MTSDALQSQLESAADGLVYSSESDRPFTFVRFDGASVPVAQLTPDEIAAVTDSLGANVTETSLDELLARHIERVDMQDAESRRLIPRYEALRDTMRSALGDVRVFRLGAIEVRCLALGNDPTTGEI
ncbi:MAG: Nuclease inhibitor-like protein, partial [Gemmatimonadetes bacterium]|nr:Nuclease inhibitor-like protein [Gemmatimonadota bacterium]